jgi:protein TonB
MVAGGWFYFTHHRQTTSPETATQLASAPATTELQPTREAVKSEGLSPNIQSSQRAAATTIATPHVPTPTEHAAPQTSKHEEKREVEAPAAPAAEPIVLSANTAKGPKPVDLDSVVPVKLPSTMVEANATGIALPAASSSAPKLAAELNIVRTPATLIKRVNPVYPSMAKTARMQGAVELLIQIGKDGSVTQVKRLNGQPILAGAAQEAVKQWRYEPAKVNGQPVETETTVKLTFDLYH